MRQRRTCTKTRRISTANTAGEVLAVRSSLDTLPEQTRELLPELEGVLQVQYGDVILMFFALDCSCNLSV